MANEDLWIDHARRALEGYDEKLLRQVANRLYRPRSQWPVEELIERTLATLTNPPVLDRRLKDLSPACRQVLALIGHSRQPRWPVGNLVEMLITLGQDDGLEPIKTLIETGLMFPFFGVNAPAKHRLRDIGQALANSTWPAVFTLPQVSARALGEPLWPSERGGRKGEGEKGRRGEGEKGVADGEVALSPPLPFSPSPLLPFSPSLLPSASPLEADGLDWPLRLAVLWQEVSAGPLRWTQQGDFFKRDLDRLRQDPLLAVQPHDALTEIPDPGLLVVRMALAMGILKEKDGSGDVLAGEFPTDWNQGLPAALASLWSQLPFLRGWNALDGWQPGEAIGNPYPSAYLIALLLLGQLGDNEWAQPETLEAWLLSRHPFWRSASAPPTGIITRFLLGVAYPLRLVQATKATIEGEGEKGRKGEGEKGRKGERETDGAPIAGGSSVSPSPLLPFSPSPLLSSPLLPSPLLIRLSPMGRWLLGLGKTPPTTPTFPQTLLVQPTLEILAYRQGLTPELIIRLSRFATWKGLGAACTLQIEPDSVYRALESGESFASLVQVLERHGMKALPAAVIESLRTWSNKRDRITVYPAGVLLEFPGPDELALALARGLPAVRLSDRLAIVQSEKDIDYRHFRLTGTRDYLALPERCVDVDADGVTLSVDLTRSDLLLETELVRFAEPVPTSPAVPTGRKLYRLTPTSTAAARNHGLNVAALDTWFQQRTGDALPASARMLLIGPDTPSMDLRPMLVLSVASAELANGLQQWPATRGLIDARLGPNRLSVLEENLAALRERMGELGMQIVEIAGCGLAPGQAANSSNPIT